MKKISTLLSAIFLLAVAADRSNAQFVYADYPQQVISPPGSLAANNTGNDILDVGTYTFEVSVWDDSNNMAAGIGWNRNGSTGYLAFSQPAVTDPDVCLAKDASNEVYAVTAYFSSGTNGYMIETFHWVSSANAFVSIGTINFGTPGNAFGSTVNIDCDDVGNFAVVWDTPNNDINIVTGHAGTPTYLNLAGSSISLFPGHSPDVAIFYYGPGNNVAQVAYVDMFDRIAVDNYRLADLASGINQPANVLTSPPANFTYHYPRIACSNVGVGQFNDWTVVAEDNDGSSTYFIVSFNEHVTTSGMLIDSYHIYNDGTTGNTPFNISNAPNLRPVVTYNAGNDVAIGWLFDNTSGIIAAPGVLVAQFPIALMCDRYANIIAGMPYENVPFGVINGSEYNGLSMSGKRSLNYLFTFNKVSSSEVYSKTVAYSPTPIHLRTTGNGNLYSWFSDALQKNTIEAENNYTLRLFDATGKLIINTRGNAYKILDFLSADRKQSLTGIYFADVVAGNKIICSGKIFMNK